MDFDEEVARLSLSDQEPVSSARGADPGSGGPPREISGPSLFTPRPSLVPRVEVDETEDQIREEYSLEPVSYIRGVAYFVTLNKTPPEFLTEAQIQQRGGGVRRSLKNSPDVLVATRPGDVDIQAPSVRSRLPLDLEDEEVHFKDPRQDLIRMIEGLKQSLYEVQQVRLLEQSARSQEKKQLEWEQEARKSLEEEVRQLQSARLQEKKQLEWEREARESFEEEVRQLRAQVRDLSTPKLKHPLYRTEHQSPPMVLSADEDDLKFTSTPLSSGKFCPDQSPSLGHHVTFQTPLEPREAGEKDDLYRRPKTPGKQMWSREESTEEKPSIPNYLEMEMDEIEKQWGFNGPSQHSQGHTGSGLYAPANTPVFEPSPHGSNRTVTYPQPKVERASSFSPHRGRHYGSHARGGSGTSDRRGESPPRETVSRRAIAEAPKFDGKWELRDFLAHFAIIADINRWSYVEKGKRLAACMTDDARSVVSSLSYEEATDFESLVRALQCRYEPPGVEVSYAAELSARVCRRDETVAAYGWALRKLIRKAYPNEKLPDRCECDYFIRGLPSTELKRHVFLARPSTIEEAISVATAFEAFDVTGESSRAQRKPRNDAEGHKLRQVSDKNKKDGNRKPPDAKPEKEQVNIPVNATDAIKKLMEDAAATNKKMLEEFTSLKSELLKQQSGKGGPMGQYPRPNNPGFRPRPYWGPAPRNGPPAPNPNPQWGGYYGGANLPAPSQGDKQGNGNWPNQYTCFHCGASDHLIRDCPLKNGPRVPSTNGPAPRPLN